MVTLKNISIISYLVVMTSCNSVIKNDKQKDSVVKTDSANVTALIEPDILDTGQVYFKVSCTRNKMPYINYEGNYPVGSRLDSDFTVQLCASKHILDVSDMLNIDIYIKSISTGKFPVIIGNEQGKAAMLMTPVKDNSFTPAEGSVTITKYNDSVISGKFEGRGLDYDSNKMTISGVFLNLKYK